MNSTGILKTKSTLLIVSIGVSTPLSKTTPPSLSYRASPPPPPLKSANCPNHFLLLGNLPYILVFLEPAPLPHLKIGFFCELQNY